MRRRNRYIVRGVAGTGVCLALGAPWVRSLQVNTLSGAATAPAQVASGAVTASTRSVTPAPKAAAASTEPSQAAGGSPKPATGLPVVSARLLPGHVRLPPAAVPQEPSVLPIRQTANLHQAAYAEGARSDAPQWLPGAVMASTPRLLARDGQHPIVAPPSPGLASLGLDPPAELPEPVRMGGAIVAPSPPTDVATLFLYGVRAEPDKWEETARDPAKAQSYQATAGIIAPLRHTPSADAMDAVVPGPEDRDPVVHARTILPETDGPIDLGEPPERKAFQSVR